VPRKVIQPFTQEHCQRLLALVSGETFEDKRNKALILLLLDTGLRLRECTELKWSDINYDSELVKVMGKGAKERIVRIGPKVQRALLEYQYLKIQSFPGDKTPDVWVSRHKTRYSDKECHPLTKNGIMQTIVVLGKRAGITNIRCSPHTFRHTFATMCLRNGAGEFEVQSLMGHSTLTQTRKYAASLNSEVAVQGHKKFSPVDNLKL
ncbi:site-specific recombinase phage integrase family protein, partial [Dehalococcoides mccartyi]